MFVLNVGVNLYKVISTFSECGGSSLGYQLAGFKVVLAIEWDKNACETYRLNFPDTDLFEGDIANLSVDEALKRTGLKAGELDILDGSPPCQGFSTAGKRNFNDDRNQLFREYIRLLKGLQPKIFVMENVSGLIKGKMKLIFAEILTDLKAAGYNVKVKLLNAMYFGVPQSRQRLIFIGTRDDLNIQPVFPKTQTKPITVRQALENCPEGLSQGEFEGKRLNLAKGIKNYRDGRDVIKGKSFNLKRLSMIKPSRTILTNVGRANSSYGGGLIHPLENRHLTISELKRVQSYPDDFMLNGSFEQQWKQIGNSVPPLMMKAIAEEQRLQLDKVT